MNSKLYCKILSVGIIVMIVGIGIQPVFAVNTNQSITNNENQISTNVKIHENTNCLIIGAVSEAFNGVRIFGKGDIVFGFKFDGEFHHSDGWIYTNGDNGRWLCTTILKDGLLGNVSSYSIEDWWSGLWVTFYVGVEGFRGLALGGHPIQEPIKNPRGADCWFIGHADHVKICYA